MKRSFENYYTEKDATYYSNVRLDLLKFLPSNSKQKVLEVGAGGGHTLRYIKENNLASYACGVELFEFKDSNQNHASIDQFVIANIEKKDLKLSQNAFDVIILADVLEHLEDPWDVLKYLEQFLTDGGYFLVSLPNIREINALQKIVFKGSFAYTDHGVLDKTHLRFFCKKNMMELLTSPNRQIEEYSASLKMRDGNRKRKLFNLLTFNCFEEFLSVQYFFKVKRFKEGTA